MMRRLRKLFSSKPIELSAADIEGHLSKFTRLAGAPKNDSAQLESQFRADELFTVREYEIDAERFDGYRAEQLYEERFPAYFEEFGAKSVWRRKLLEHFISFDIVEPRRAGVYIDVASSNSPVPTILREHFGAVKAYRQDLRYRSGVHGEEIGSDAAEIPLPDESVDGIFMHNSWEHFEGDSDRRALRECERLLRPGGRVCIIPLNVESTGYQITSPDEWSRKAGGEALPAFDTRLSVLVREADRQRLVKMHSFETLREDAAGLSGLDFTLTIVTNNTAYGFQRYFLSAEKRAR